MTTTRWHPILSSGCGKPRATAPRLFANTPTAAIDFNRGYIAQFGPAGISAAPAISPYATPALGMYAAGGTRRSIMNFAHHRIHHHMPTVTITDVPMWVRSHNGSTIPGSGAPRRWRSNC